MNASSALWPQRVHAARVRFCAVSGKIPRPRCLHTVWTWFVPDLAPLAACDGHREDFLREVADMID